MHPAMKAKTLIAAIFSACLMACGAGGSGIDSNKSVKDLTMEEKMTFCSYNIEQQGGAGTSMCGEGVEVTTDSVAECAAADLSMVNATCTVGMAEACADATGGDRCKNLTEQACATYLACLLGGG